MNSPKMCLINLYGEWLNSWTITDGKIYGGGGLWMPHKLKKLKISCIIKVDSSKNYKIPLKERNIEFFVKKEFQ